MVKVLLVDDESRFLQELASQHSFRVEVVGNLINVFDALKKISEMKVTGMIVNDRAYESDRKKANFRIKQDLGPEIVLVMATAEKYLEMSSPNRAVSKQVTQKPERISLWDGNRIVMINVEKIACCFLEKGSRKVMVVAENKIYQSNYTLHAFLSMVGEKRLIRCHRSFAINPDYLSEMFPGENNTMIAKVAGYNREIPVSRQYSHIFKSIAGLRIRSDCKRYCP